MSRFDYIFTTFALLARHASVPRWNFATHACQMTALPYLIHPPAPTLSPIPPPFYRSSPHTERRRRHVALRGVL
jgi:hypothetical protein